MYKYLSFAFLFIFAQLISTDIRRIEYFEKPDFESFRSSLKVEDFLKEEKTFLNFSKPSLEAKAFLHSFLNQPKKALILEDSFFAENLSKALLQVLEQSQNAFTLYRDWVRLFSKAIECFNYIPNPTEELIHSKKCFIHFFAKLSDLIPSVLKEKIFCSESIEAYRSIHMATLFLEASADLKKYIETFVYPLPEMDRATFYQEWLDTLQLEQSRSLFRALEENEKIILAQALFENSLFSYKTHEQLSMLIKEAKEETYVNLIEIARQKPLRIRDTLLTVLQDRDRNVSALTKAPDTNLPPPGRVGNSSIYQASFGDIDLIFHMIPEKYCQSLATIDAINKETIISVDHSLINSSVPEYVTANKKYGRPIGFQQNLSPAFYDAKGHEFEEWINRKNCETAESIFACKPLFSRSQIHLKINHDGAKWHQPFPYYFSKPAGSKDLWENLSALVEYSVIDWQLSPSTISGILFQKGLLGDRFLLYVRDKDHFSVCFTKPLTDGDDSFFILEPGAFDEKSQCTAGSTKGKTINTVFYALIEKEAALKEKRKWKKFVKNSCDMSEGKRVYKNGIQFIPEKNTLLFQAGGGRERYMRSVEGVDIYSLDGEAAQNSVYEDFCSKRVREIYRIVKRTKGMSCLSDMGLTVKDSDTVLLFSRTKLPEGYKNYSLAQDQAFSGAPWIQMYYLPKGFYIQLDGRLWKSLSLTPVEEIFFRDALIDSKSFDHHKDMERLEVVYDVIVLKE